MRVSLPRLFGLTVSCALLVQERQTLEHGMGWSRCLAGTALVADHVAETSGITMSPDEPMK